VFSGQEGLKAILRVLGTATSLESLNVARNENIGPFFDFTTFIPTPPTTPTIATTTNDDTLLFPHLQHLDFSECQLKATSCTSLFQSLATLTSIPAQRHHPGLTVKLNSNDLGDSTEVKKMVEYIKKCSFLSQLYLSNCQLGDNGLQSMVDVLSVNNNKNDSPSMRVFDISTNNLTNVSINYFFSRLLESDVSGLYFSNLQKLILTGNSLNEECCRNIATAIRRGPLLSLKELDVTGTNCSVRGAMALISMNANDDGDEINQSSLKQLNLFGNQLGSDGFVELSKVLQGGHPTLESLDLGGNEATEAGVVALLQAFTAVDNDTKNSLRLLVVGGNRGGPTIETIVQEIQRVHPKLDVARDKPRSSTNTSISPFSQMNLPAAAQGTSWMA
jgi:Ran GTPase-activating protein (RanGAP) involved in mRNA processing and transport